MLSASWQPLQSPVPLLLDQNYPLPAPDHVDFTSNSAPCVYVSLGSYHLRLMRNTEGHIASERQ
jgi:hypothetical protein